MANIPLFLHDDMDKYFYNRTKEIKRIKYILNSLNESIPQQLLLVGYRGVGKSYLLKKIKKELPDTLLSINIDISKIYSINKSKITPEKILLHFLEEINKEYLEKTGTKDKIIHQIKTHFQKLQIKDFDFNQMTKISEIPIPKTNLNYEKLSKFVMQLPQKIVDENENITGFIIILDEFQMLRKLDNPDSFFWLIRSFNQHQHNVSYVFTGSLSKTSNIIESLNGETGAFGGRLIQITIEPFTKQETKNYFNNNLNDIKFTEDGFDRFYECTRGIPLYINSFYNVLSQNEVYDEEKIKKTFMLNMEQILWKISRIWGSLNDYEKEIVEVLIDYKGLTWTELFDQVSFTKKTLNKYLGDLRNKGIIEYKDKEYYIADKMLITWLRHEKVVNGYYPT